MMTAPKLDFLIDVFDSKNYNPQSYDVLVKEKLEKLYDLLDRIKPLSADEYKVLYFSVEKGNIEEYANYEELKEYEEKIKKLIDIENPTREFLQTIIEKIIIDNDKNIEIIYKFSILNSL